MQDRFNLKCVSVRPVYLKSPGGTGKCLEIDCQVHGPGWYIDAEFHGRQHKERVPFFQPKEGDFEKQVRYDNHKRKILNGMKNHHYLEIWHDQKKDIVEIVNKWCDERGLNYV